jgi:hypothetical protein
LLTTATIVKGFGDLLRDRQGVVEPNRATRNPLREIVALDQLHDERPDTVGVVEPVDAGDVRMIQRGEGLRFTLEAREPVRVLRERLGQNLDGDVAIQLRVARAVDLAHPAFADRRSDFIGAETGAGGQSQSGMDHTGGTELSTPAVTGGGSDTWSARAEQRAPADGTWRIFLGKGVGLARELRRA